MITRMGLLGTALNEALDDHSDMIIHTGSFQGEGKAIRDPQRMMKNIQNTFKWLEEARETNRKFVFISTWDWKVNPYTFSKRTGENMVRLWASTYNVPYLILEIPSILETYYMKRGIIHYFITCKEDPVIQDRELQFLSLNEIVGWIKENIEAKNNTLKLAGERISVKLLYHLLNTVKEK